MLDNRTVGRTIADLRQANGMTQQKLAATMNVSHQAVSKWENGAALPDMQTMLDLSRLFGVTMEQLLLGEVPEERLKSREEEEKKPQLADFQLPDFDLRGAVKDVVNGIGSLFKAPAPIASREDEEIVDVAAYEEAIEREVEAAVLNAVAEAEIEREVEAAVSEAMDDEAIDEAIDAAIECEVEEAVLSSEDCGAEEVEGGEEQAERAEEADEAAENSIDVARLCQMAPFMSREALAELVCQYRGKFSESDIVRLAPFVTRKCLEEMIWRLDGTVDWNMLHKLAPFAGRETMDRLVREYKGKVPMENITRLAPFVSKDCLEELIWNVDGTLDWDMLRRFAPFLGKQAVDRMAMAITKGEKLVRPAVGNTVKAAENMGRTIQKKAGEVDWNEFGDKINDLGDRIGAEVEKTVRGAVKFGESVVREVGKVFAPGKVDHPFAPENKAQEKKTSDRARETRRRMFERAMQDDKWDWIAERIDDLEDEVLKNEIISRAAELGMTDWLSENVDGYISNEMVRNALAEKNWIWLSANFDEIDEAMHGEIVRAATAEHNWNWLAANLHMIDENLHELIAREAVKKDGFGFLLVNVANLELGSAALEIAIEAVRASRGDVAIVIVEEHLNEDEALTVAMAAIGTACEDKVLWIAEHLGTAGINQLCVELAEQEKWELLGLVIEHAEETTVDAVCMKLAVKGAWKQVEKFVQNAGEDAVAQMMDMAVDAGDWEAIDMLEEYMD